MDLRRQRIENEWVLLGEMAKANPACIGVKQRQPDGFLLFLKGNPAPVKRDQRIVLLSDHELRFSFVRFFPAAPIEAYLARPIFHPNVHPTTGFVCLWSRFSQTDTVVEALCRLQRIMAFDVFSDSSDDVMQPEALAWAMNSGRGTYLPLPRAPLVKPPSYTDERGIRDPRARRRLS